MLVEDMARYLRRVMPGRGIYRTAVDHQAGISAVGLRCIGVVGWVMFFYLVLDFGGNDEGQKF